MARLLRKKPLEARSPLESQGKHCVSKSVWGSKRIANVMELLEGGIKLNEPQTAPQPHSAPAYSWESRIFRGWRVFSIRSRILSFSGDLYAKMNKCFLPTQATYRMNAIILPFSKGKRWELLLGHQWPRISTLFLMPFGRGEALEMEFNRHAYVTKPP